MLWTLAVALVAVTACHPRVETRAIMPTTELCPPHQYLLPYQASPTDTHMFASADGLLIGDVTAISRIPEWDDARGGIADRFDLADGRWLILIRGKRAPADPPIGGQDPHVAYLWDPAEKTATLVGRGYWLPLRVGPFFLLIRGSQLMFADVDPDKSVPALRALGPYREQTLLGSSAGTAVLWVRDGTQVSVSCLGGDTARHVTVPTNLEPTADAVRDQRVLLQGPNAVDGHAVRAPLYVLDLDRARVRFIGMAAGGFEDAYTNIPRMVAVTRAAWSGSRVLVPIGNISAVNRVDPATEAIGR